ncbi:uncharacterized protein TRIADDRAFT_55699 [Trichoplax adhaerens]|uniref:G-protein coupled receptors family 1 profile domain-containing protein n=1 Tax=Trichoplax adhaerens TaxID=10228 RepID=B3RVL9_TRIAD|nr:hypothetical protein TRIADDRAFT_55699 [Trichoplax adhaerens]EDV25523.1 hypothetical protein TRIADDRAFT_55699 [Trichoplax adhaerens]|eukprot:XP_002111556.1 hypothetical protein TRIADDRAFT_55699 [Trichoplax adhaerens]
MATPYNATVELQRQLRYVIFYEIIGVVIILTNSPLIYVILSQHRLRNLHNLMICSMSFCAIFFALLYCLPYIFTIFYRESLFCSISVPIRNFLTIAISLHLCIIAVDKALIIGFPLHYPSLSNKKLMVVLIMIIWLIAVAAGFYPLFTFRTRYKIENNLSCVTTVSLDHEIPYHWFFYSTLICLPVICMIISYSYIYCIAMQQWKKILDHQLLINDDTPAQRRRRKIGLHFKTAIPLIAITGAFILMHLPFYICSAISYAMVPLVTMRPINIDDRLSYLKILGNLVRAMAVLKEVAYAYPAVNPFLYAYFDIAIRSVVVKVFTIRRDRSFADTRRTTAAAPLNPPQEIAMKRRSTLPNGDQIQRNTIDEAIVESCGQNGSS